MTLASRSKGGTVGVTALTVPVALRARIVESALRALPGEAVGLLGGDPDGRVRRVLPLPNLLSVGAFLADPYAQYRAIRSLEGDGLLPLALYHSHPGGGTGLSAADITHARPHDLLQLVLAIRFGEPVAVDMAAYRVNGDRPTRIELIWAEE